MVYPLFHPCGPQLLLAHPVLSPHSPVKTLNITLVKQLLFEMPEDLVYITVVVVQCPPTGWSNKSSVPAYKMQLYFVNGKMDWHGTALFRTHSTSALMSSQYEVFISPTHCSDISVTYWIVFSWKRHFSGVCRLKSIVKHRICGLEKNVSCTKNWWTNLNNLCIVWRVFCARSCLLGVAVIAPALTH